MPCFSLSSNKKVVLKSNLLGAFNYVLNRWYDSSEELSLAFEYLKAADDETRKFTFNQNVYRRAFFNGTRAIQYIVTLSANSEGHTEDENGKPFSLTIEPGHYYNLSVKMKGEDSQSPQITLSITVDGKLLDEIPLTEKINPYQ